MSENTYGFGCARLKEEGGPIHPDDLINDMSDEKYLQLLQNYKDRYGREVYDIPPAREYLLPLLK